MWRKKCFHLTSFWSGGFNKIQEGKLDLSFFVALGFGMKFKVWWRSWEAFIKSFYEKLGSAKLLKHYKVLTFSLHVFRVGIICQSRVGNPFHATGLLPLENVRKPEVFWCFQGVQKETSGMKWVNFERIQNI